MRFAGEGGLIRAMTELGFIKMHGLGNDFVVLDARAGALALDVAQRRAVADRRRGVGCDQLVVMEPSARADVFMRIYNADGSEAGACGNATRCVARLVGGERVVVETVAGLLPCRVVGGDIEVDMGPVRTAWAEVPLAREQADTARVDLSIGPLTGPACCNLGNPHATFLVLDAEAVDVAGLGPLVETHALFPEKVNVGFLEIRTPTELRLRIWERGAGVTQACGSGASAALVAAVRRGFAERRATVHLDGGPLLITWREDDGHVLMRGPATQVFTGTLNLDDLALARA